MCHDGPPSEEVALVSSDAVEVDEWTRILPVAESQSIVIWATTKVEYDPEDNET